MALAPAIASTPRAAALRLAPRRAASTAATANQSRLWFAAVDRRLHRRCRAGSAAAPRSPGRSRDRSSFTSSVARRIHGSTARPYGSVLVTPTRSRLLRSGTVALHGPAGSDAVRVPAREPHRHSVPATGVLRLRWRDAAADLRCRDRVRGHLHLPRPATPVARTRWRATCSAGSCRGGARRTSSCATAPGSTWTSAATPSTPRPSATRWPSSSPTTRRASGSSRTCSSTPSAGWSTRASAATSTCSRTTPTPRATPTAATRTTWSRGPASSPGSPTCCCRSWSPAS